MRVRVRVVVLAGLLVIVGAVVVTLSRSPLVVAGSNSVSGTGFVATTQGEATFCQSGETLPSGTRALRLWVNTNINPRVQVVVRSGSTVVTEGVQQPGRLTSAIAIPVALVPRSIQQATVCFNFGPAVEPVRLVGGYTPRRRPGEPRVKIRVEYLRAGLHSWWSQALSVARRIGLGRAPSGTWVAFVPVVLMLIAGLLAVRLVLRELVVGRTPIVRMRIPEPAWICAVVACLSAISWSILTPPFQVSDEPSHFAYVQQLAEAHRLPTSGESKFSQEEEVALEDLHESSVQFSAGIGTIATAAQQRRLESDLAEPLARRGPGGAGVAASEPPLYYLLETIPYELGSSGTLLDQLTLMRLLSALMAGVSALFVFLFLREALPRVPWAWSVGGLATALAPLLGFISGAVNPDSMLCALSAALFYCLARAFRRGLTRRLAIAIGVLAALGFLTKLNFLGLVPGIAVALAILTLRAARTQRRAAYISLAVALAITASPVVVYIVANLLSDHMTLGLLSSGARLTSEHHSLTQEITYIWELYLPRLPGMPHDFPDVSTIRQIWFDRSVGAYGWIDTYFPSWVYELALVPAGVIAVLFLRSLIAARVVLWARAGEVVAYVLIGVGVLALVGADSYLEFPGTAGSYSEPRYLLALAVGFATVLALAARGAGRRWGPPTGALIVLLIFAQDIFGQLLVVGRYYG
jgi:hypothetical protein